jgi:hypothetical protein
VTVDGGDNPASVDLREVDDEDQCVIGGDA